MNKVKVTEEKLRSLLRIVEISLLESKDSHELYCNTDSLEYFDIIKCLQLRIELIQELDDIDPNSSKKFKQMKLL